MTKEHGVPILISDTTRAWLREPAADLFDLGELPVRGRSAPLRAWTLRPPAA
jgi:class 3 adenylate cyclase